MLTPLPVMLFQVVSRFGKLPDDLCLVFIPHHGLKLDYAVVDIADDLLDVQAAGLHHLVPPFAAHVAVGQGAGGGCAFGVAAPSNPCFKFYAFPVLS